jgi:hypothetical protein
MQSTVLYVTTKFLEFLLSIFPLNLGVKNIGNGIRRILGSFDS